MKKPKKLPRRCHICGAKRNLVVCQHMSDWFDCKERYTCIGRYEKNQVKFGYGPFRVRG